MRQNVRLCLLFAPLRRFSTAASAAAAYERVAGRGLHWPRTAFWFVFLVLFVPLTMAIRWAGDWLERAIGNPKAGLDTTIAVAVWCALAFVVFPLMFRAHVREGLRRELRRLEAAVGPESGGTGAGGA